MQCQALYAIGYDTRVKHQLIAKSWSVLNEQQIIFLCVLQKSSEPIS
jgi:hypothetical protein